MEFSIVELILTIILLVFIYRYFENRTKQISTWSSSNVSPYPHKFNTTMQVSIL